jgi:hypothetical protein
MVRSPAYRKPTSAMSPMKPAPSIASRSCRTSVRPIVPGKVSRMARKSSCWSSSFPARTRPMIDAASRRTGNSARKAK